MSLMEALSSTIQAAGTCLTTTRSFAEFRSVAGLGALCCRVAVCYSAGLASPAAVELADGFDSVGLRERCLSGMLYFSVEGLALPRGLNWDVDGDYDIALENFECVASVQEVALSMAKAPR